MHRLTTYVMAAAAFSGALVLSAATPTTATPRAAGHVAADLTVGSVALQRCHLGLAGRPTYCGSIKVPLNYHSSADGTITAGFAFVPAAHPASGHTPRVIVAEEGGPGYPSTGSITDYATMLGGHLLDNNNLLLVDERGIGRSTPMTCKAMQSIYIVTTTPAFERTVHSCGESLNHRFHRTGGGFVHASDLFTTANAARDMARVLTALGTGKVDLYGDSYGTYFAQAFLSRYPHRLRSVTLDSAYEARDLDPFYRTTVSTARRAFDTACVRSAACHAAAPGKSWHRIAALAKLLRAHPFSGTAPGVDAKSVPVRIDVTSLVNIVNDAGYDYDPYRQLDAAARAYLTDRDPTPLLRLYAQDIGYDYGDYNGPIPYYTDGEYFAVGCSDYPQLFDMRDSPKQRRAEFAEAEAKSPPHLFAPFTMREWVAVNPFTETYHACTSWPRSVHHADPPVRPDVSMDATHVPVLILNGEFDSLTPAAGGAHIHLQIGSASRQIVTANTVHLVGEDNPFACGPRLIRRFMVDPARLHSMHASCAPHVPTIRTIGNFPEKVDGAAPVHGTGPVARRELAAVGLAAAGDAAIRYNYVDGSRDLGLRGGKIRYRPAKGASYAAVLNGDRWTADSTVSGTLTFSPNAQSGHGTVTISGPGGATLRCHVRWKGEQARIVTAHHHWKAPAP